MKLVRYGTSGNEKPGILDRNGRIRSLEGATRDLAGSILHPDSIAELGRLDLDELPLVDEGVRIGPCVGGVGKFICIGLNYADHVAESNMENPAEPVVFFKATSAICGPNDNIIIPRDSQKTDWEVELGVVIGKTASYVTEEEALEYVAGYCVINDLSERAFQLEGTGQWVKGKSCDTFGPIGPYLVTPDDVPDPQNLELWLEVDGHRYQHSSTQEMIFGVASLISYLSRFMSLHAGDVISTGTPHGVGMGLNPPRYLQPGSMMRLGISGLGEQQQKVISHQEALDRSRHESRSIPETA